MKSPRQAIKIAVEGDEAFALAYSDPSLPLVVTQRSNGNKGEYTITHAPSGLKVSYPASRRAARRALPRLLKLTDWTADAAKLRTVPDLNAMIKKTQNEADAWAGYPPAIDIPKGWDDP